MFKITLLLITFTLSSLTQAENAFQQDQLSYGNWTPQKYLENGWSGYHVVTHMTKQKNFASYKSGDDTYYVGPLCVGGDCQYRANTSIFAMEQGSGRSQTLKTLVGTVKHADHGALERVELLNPSNIAIARYDETEAQSRMRMDEAQVTTLYKFDSAGNAIELGHVEEADAPGMYNQIESYYARRDDGTDHFLTSVVEKVLYSYEDSGLEEIRIGTIWCNSDRHRLTNSILKLLYKDTFDFAKECGEENTPVRSWSGIAKQFFFGRGNSKIALQNPDDRRQVFNYFSGSNMSSKRFIGLSNGTAYTLIGNKDEKDKEYVAMYADSEVINSMSNCQSSGVSNYSTICNQPKLKFFEMNFNRSKNFKPLTDSNQYLASTPNNFALIVTEKTGEVKTRMDGKTCQLNSWGNVTDPDAQALNAERTAAFCDGATTYILHTYILIPNNVGGKNLTKKQKLMYLDQVLAAMPDQTQQSPELAAAEEYLDFIRAFEMVKEAGTPDVLDLNMLVDLNTEEDSLTAQAKIWDLFTDLGSVQVRSNRADEQNKKSNQPRLNRDSSKKESDL